MSEIEKLYENAGIEPRCIGCYYNLPCCRNCNKNYKDTIDKTCKYQIVKEEYPPFTAEKQLELIKWLIANVNCAFVFTIKPSEFTEYLARYVNNIWQDLIETEKAEIKEILK